MRGLKYFVACTVDRFIAAEDGSIDAFVNDEEYFAELFEMFPETCPGHLRQALGVRGANRQFDTVLMGRTTYEAGLGIGVTNPYPILKQYVFSTTMEESPDENVTLVSEDAAGLLGGLKSEPGKDIWLAGGATLAASLFSEGLVDELKLKVNPVVLGSGIPLFSGGTKNVDLDLEDSRMFAGGVALLRYRVKKWGRTIHRYLPAQQDFLPGYGMPGMVESPAMCRTFCDAVMRFAKRFAGGKEP